MVIRVHNGTADSRADTHMAFTPCFTDINKVMVAVAYYADGCTAEDRNHAHFAGWKAERGIFAFFCHQLRCIACGAYHLAAFARVKLNVVDLRTNRNAVKRQAVANPYFGIRATHNLHAVCKTGRCKDIGFFAVLIFNQGNIRCPIRIVFDSNNCS